MKIKMFITLVTDIICAFLFGFLAATNYGTTNFTISVVSCIAWLVCVVCNFIYWMSREKVEADEVEADIRRDKQRGQ